MRSEAKRSRAGRPRTPAKLPLVEGRSEREGKGREQRQEAMGQGLSYGSDRDQDFFRAVELGEVELIEASVGADPGLLRRGTPYDRFSALHIAAAKGRTKVLSMILDWNVEPDILNRHKQTPLMLAAMHGKIACVEKLLSAGANILIFDSLHGRTCLHYAAYYGHHDCLKTILQAAKASPICEYWGFAHFLNVRDGDAPPLHLLLHSGALVGASTGWTGSTPLHLAARRGSVDCVRALLDCGADRLQTDSSGRIPYTVALRWHHSLCAALLDPSPGKPLVWPARLKFIRELEPGAKALLEMALIEANLERERSILKEATVTSTVSAAPLMMMPLVHPDSDESRKMQDTEADLCYICFEQACTIEVRFCGHQMCASCILALCCHNKPDPCTLVTRAPVCPFCRGRISQLVVAQKSTNVAEGGGCY